MSELINKIEKYLKDKKVKRERNKFFARQREEYHKKLLKEEEINAEKEKIAPQDCFLSLQHINKIYDNHVQAVFDFNLDIKEKEFIVFVGPSGCGKSTTLRMIAGLEDITSGDLFIDGVYANNLLPKERNLSMVFQSYALYPHMTVYDNLSFGLKIQKTPKEEIDKRVHEVAKLLEIEEFLNRKPKQLSGGQCQRVALGRAIMRNMKLFLMDEPLSNLDAKLRVQMRGEIVKLHNKIGATTIYVTHDQTEAMTMADRIVVMNKGYIQQIGTPEDIYNNPVYSFVASFIGSPAMNLINASYENSNLKISENISIKINNEIDKKIKNFFNDEVSNLLKEKEEAHQIYENEIQKIKEKDRALFDEVYTKERDIDAKITTLRECINNNKFNLQFGVRPEDVQIKEEGLLKGVVILSESLGSEYYVHIKLDGLEVVAKVDNKRKYILNESINLDFDINRCHLFDPISTKRIN